MEAITQKTLLLHINETKESDDADASRINELKKTIFALLHNPASSKQALWTNIFLSFVIVLSSAAFMISSLPYFWERHNDTLLYPYAVVMVEQKRGWEVRTELTNLY
jgi:hypothetical protein